MFKIIGYEPEEIPDRYWIEYWYDRHQRYWVIQVFNNGAEVECQVGVNKHFLHNDIAALEEQYNTHDIRKV